MKLRRPILMLVAACAIASTVACSRSARFPKDPRDACEFVVMLDKPVYRVGEMVVAKVAVSNRAMVPIVISPPHSVKSTGASNLDFRRTAVGDSKILRRPPVVIVPKTRTKAVRLDPFQTLVEKFAFVNLTEHPGRYRVLVEYRGNPQPDTFPRPKPPEVPLPLTRVVEYEVREPALVRRGPNGLILRDEAIRVARQHYARPVRGARAVLVQTESALHDWWVTLEKAPDDVRKGETPFVAYYVSPYGGFVRQETEPLTVDPKSVVGQESER